MEEKVQTVYAKRIKSGSLAGLVFSATGMLMIPMCTFFGILALFGGKTVQLNGAYVTGIGGFLLSLLYGPLLTVIFGLIAWAVTYLSIRFIGRFRPFRIEFVVPDGNLPNKAPEPTTTSVMPAAEQPSRRP